MHELPTGKKFSIGKPGEDSKEFYFSLGTTAVELMRGLGGVTGLGPYDGMVFDFGCKFSPIMTPKGLLFPVEVAFVTDYGEIVEIHRLDPGYEFTQGTARKDIQYALEVPVGFFDLHGVAIGTFLFDIQPGNSPYTNKIA